MQALGRVIFSETLATNDATTGGSDVLGPGRLSRCSTASIVISFPADSTAGTLAVQGSHHQSFPGTPATIATVTWAAAGTTHAVQIPPEWLGHFVRIKPSVATTGSGYSAWASGRA